MSEIKDKFFRFYQETLMQEADQKKTRHPLTLRLPSNMVAELNELAILVQMSRTEVVETLLRPAIHDAVIGVMEASEHPEDVEKAIKAFYEHCSTEGVLKLQGGAE